MTTITYEWWNAALLTVVGAGYYMWARHIGDDFRRGYGYGIFFLGAVMLIVFGWHWVEDTYGTPS